MVESTSEMRWVENFMQMQERPRSAKAVREYTVYAESRFLQFVAAPSSLEG